jgi:hypothetical protein
LTEPNGSGKILSAQWLTYEAAKKSLKLLDFSLRGCETYAMNRNRRPQKQKPRDVQRVQELRRSNAATPVANKTRYSRSDRRQNHIRFVEGY